MVNITVGNKKIGDGEPIFIIAECGINHNGQLSMAKKLVEAAVEAGCSAAKFQTFEASQLYVPQAGNYRLHGKDIPIYDLHVKLKMPEEWIGELADFCKSQDIIFFSTPVSPECVDLIDPHVPLFKVSSYDMTYIPLIEHLNTKGKPVIFSTGASWMSEVAETVETLTVPYGIMQCVAKYPCPFKYANLNIMKTLKQAFDVPVGFSSNGFVDENGDIDTERVPARVAELRADIFETHITLDRKGESVDDFFAIEPHELKQMVAGMQTIRQEMDEIPFCDVGIDRELDGSPVRQPYDIEEYCRKFLFRCLFAKKDIAAGERFTPENVAVLRPGEYPKRGLESKYYKLITTKATARKAVKQWEAIDWSVIL
jgi:sialic acid synthase SpsE